MDWVSNAKEKISSILVYHDLRWRQHGKRIVVYYVDIEAADATSCASVRLQ